MKKSGWCVYVRDRNGDFVRLTKPFATKEQAEKEREKMRTRPQYSKLGLGIGYVDPHQG